MKKILFTLIAITGIAVAQQGIPVPGMSHCDQEMTQFMNTYGIPAATFAMAKDGKLVYMRSFGHADIAKTEPTQPHHMFRIASLSKPITSIAIMKMLEDGDLRLSEKVFGPAGIMKNNTYFSNTNITDNRIEDITVQHLLEHSGGWNRDVDCVPSPNPPYTWNINHCDPIGFPLYVTQQLGESNPVSRRALVKFLLEKGLDFTPGTDYAYSNIGYLLLGLVIEEKSGMSYEAYLKKKIFEPIGTCDMHVASNLRADKREREGEYVGNGYMALSIYGTGQNVPWEYGGLNVEAMDAHGGWIASARDLVRLISAVDGFNTRPDILSRASINTMTSPSSNNARYAKGWSVNQFNNWWHTGAIDGTASVMVRSGQGYAWAVILNKRIIDNRANAFWSALDNLPWTCLSNTNNWPGHDFFDVPSENATALSFGNGTSSSFDVNWQRGNGEKCIVLAREGSAVDAFPLDGVSYNADATFGDGDELGSGNFVVYNGPAASVNVKGLDENKIYHFRIFEYNQNAGTGNHALYQLCNYAEGEEQPSATVGFLSLKEQGVRYYPNPATSILNVELPDASACDKIKVADMFGKTVMEMPVLNKMIQLEITDLPAQVYVLTFEKEGNILGATKLWKQ